MQGHTRRINRWIIGTTNILALFGLLICVATLCGFLGQLLWLLDLFSHFRVQYLLGLVILGAVLLLARRWRFAACCLVCAGVNLAVVAPLYFGPDRAATEPHSKLRAMLINVNTRMGDPDRVKREIQRVNPDVLVLAEISTQWVRELESLALAYPYQCLEPREDNFGIGLFSRLPLADCEIACIGEAGVPSILAIVHAGGGNLRLIATHPPPPIRGTYAHWRHDQLMQLSNYTRSDLPVVVLGDLNATPWSCDFRQLLNQTGLMDSAKGHGVQPTWPSRIPPLRIPIDHCLHSADVTILGREVGSFVGSDHYPLIVDLAVPGDRNSP